MRKPIMLPLRFPNAPGSASGCSFIYRRLAGVGSLETCSARVYRSSRKVCGAIFAHVSRSAQGRFTRDGGRSGGPPEIQIRLR